MELPQNIESFGYDLARFKAAWRAINEQLDFFADHWPKASEKNLSGSVSIERADTQTWQLNGQALGKLFRIQATPILVEADQRTTLYAELVVTTPAITSDAHRELGRVRLNRDSAIFTTEGTKVLDEYDDMASYKLLLTVINCVLRTKAA